MIEIRMKVTGEKAFIEALNLSLQNFNDNRVESKHYIRNGVLYITAKGDATRVRAILNSYLRIIQVAEKVEAWTWKKKS